MTKEEQDEIRSSAAWRILVTLKNAEKALRFVNALPLDLIEMYVTKLTEEAGMAHLEALQTSTWASSTDESREADRRRAERSVGALLAFVRAQDLYEKDQSEESRKEKLHQRALRAAETRKDNAEDRRE